MPRDPRRVIRVTARMRVVVPERVGLAGRPEQFVYHLPAGPLTKEADFWPIKCGGGIVFPHRDTRPETDVCPDCLAGTVTL
jgi:hypothetical protein